MHVKINFGGLKSILTDGGQISTNMDQWLYSLFDSVLSSPKDSLKATHKALPAPGAGHFFFPG